MTETERFQRAIAAFDAANSEDPNTVDDDGRARPRELVMAERLSATVARLEPNASEALRLAARCQHIRRWTSPRSSHPAGRLGYLAWRKALSRFHADESEAILRSVGYDPDTIERVRRLNLKRNLRSDPEMQTLEDALCLVFMTWQLESFAAPHSDERVLGILQKTLAKMSPRGHQAAMGLTLSQRLTRLLRQAMG